MMFWSATGAEEISASGTSYLNRAEASGVEKVVTHLLRSGVDPGRIGVVTPYEGQRAYVVQHMTRAGAFLSICVFLFAYVRAIGLTSCFVYRCVGHAVIRRG